MLIKNYIMMKVNQLKYINLSILLITAVFLMNCESDDFDGLTDSRVTDVEISFPEADNTANPLYRFTGVAASPVENVPVKIQVTSQSGKVAQAAWVDPLYSGCLGFAGFSFTSVVDTGTEILSGEDAINFWVSAGNNFGGKIDLGSSGSTQTFDFNLNVDDYSVFWLGAPDRIGVGECAAEDHRLRFIVLFTDGSVDVSQELRFRFLQ